MAVSSNRVDRSELIFVFWLWFYTVSVVNWIVVVAVASAFF
jgi:hypothetical protein